MKIIIKSIFFLLASILVLQAQESSTVCGRDLYNHEVEGTYKMIVGPGIGTTTAYGQTMSISVPREAPETVTITEKIGVYTLHGSHRLKVILREIDKVLKKEWRFSDDKRFGGLSSEDMLLATGCQEMRFLPRLEGIGTFISEDGILVHVKVRLIIFEMWEDGMLAMGDMRYTARGVKFKVRIDLQPKTVTNNS